MRIVCWIPKATNTHKYSGSVIFIAFPLQNGCTNGPHCYVIRTWAVLYLQAVTRCAVAQINDLHTCNLEPDVTARWLIYRMQLCPEWCSSTRWTASWRSRYPPLLLQAPDSRWTLEVVTVGILLHCPARCTVTVPTELTRLLPFLQTVNI